MGTVFVLVAIVAVLADHPLSNLAGAGLIMLIGGVVAATVGVVVDLLSSAPGIRGERVVRWSAAVALVLFAAGAVLIGLDALLA